MRNVKKLFSLVLTLALLASVLALPAMAVSEEHAHGCECTRESVIQPRYPAAPCIQCGGPTTFMGYGGGGANRTGIYHCSKCNLTFEEFV